MADVLFHFSVMDTVHLSQLFSLHHFTALPFMIKFQESCENTLEVEEVCLMLAPNKKFRYCFGPASSRF